MRTTDGFFDGYAVDFDAIYGTTPGILGGLINRVFRRSMVLRFQRAVAGCQPVAGKTILDVGCGPGHYGVTLARLGAASVTGIDFAGGMIDLAERNARAAGVAERCRFVRGDFMEYPFGQRFDYSIVTGVMDYIREARPFIERVCSLTTGKAFFSFPAAVGFLAWQRRLRYRSRCPLYLYRPDQIERLLDGLGSARAIEKIGRDYFVTLRFD